MKKVLLTGISGFLGAEFTKAFHNDFEIHGTYFQNPIHFPNVQTHQIDLRIENHVDKLIEKIAPDVIIHLAALSDPNACELDPQGSYSNNVLASLYIAKVAAKNKIPLFAASTDLVFDGINAPYSEDSEKNPISIYGKHKAQLEDELLQIHPNVVIGRLPLMYGLQHGNAGSFLQGMIKKLDAEETIKLFKDEFRTVAWSNDVCRGIMLCLEAKPGIYHLGGSESLSRFEMGEMLCDIFLYDKNLLQPSLQREVTMPAKRPADVSLNSNKAKAIGWNPNTFANSLKMMKQMK